MAISLSSNANTAVFSSSVQSPAKAGMIQPFAGTTAPSGWALCDGSAVSTTTYPDLYTQIGNTWDTSANQSGSGGNYTAPGAGLFRLPDLRGVFLRGAGTSTKANGTGSITVTLASYVNDSTAVNALATTSSTVTGIAGTNSSSTVTGQSLSGSAPSLTGTVTFPNTSHTHDMSHVHQTMFINNSYVYAPSLAQSQVSSFTLTGIQNYFNVQAPNVSGGSNFPLSAQFQNNVPAYTALPVDSGGTYKPNTGTPSANTGTVGISGGSYSLTGTPTAGAQTWTPTGTATAAAQTLTGSTETAPRYTGINYLIKLYNDSVNLAVSTGQMIVDGNNTFSQLSVSPASPQTGYLALYAKNDGNFYQKTPAGVETQLGGGGGGSTVVASTSVQTPILKAYNTGGLTFQNSGATAYGTMDNTGSWTFGGTSASTTHVFQSGGATNLKMLTSAAGTVSVQLNRTANTPADYFLYIPTGSSDIRILNNSTSADVFAINSSGQTTIGPAAAIGGNTFSGNLIVGKTNASTTAAGYVGEIKTATVGAVTLSTTSTFDAASLVLTSGMWMVYGKLSVNNAGTTQTFVNGSISLTSATENVLTLCSDNTTGVTSNQRRFNVTPLYVNTTGQTVYLTARCNYTGTAPSTSATETYLYAIRIA